MMLLLLMRRNDWEWHEDISFEVKYGPLNKMDVSEIKDDSELYELILYGMKVGMERRLGR